MNYIGELIDNSIPIIQKSLLYILSFFSFLNPDTSTINKANIEGGLISPVNSLVTFSKSESNTTQDIPKERTDQTVDTFYTSTHSSSPTPANKNQLTQSIDKFRELNLQAPNYSILKTVISSDNIQTNKNKTEVNIETESIKSLDGSVINIRCENKTGKTFKVITGSGVIISSSGLVLTAAHVAAPIYGQKNAEKYNCYAKINNPATGNYALSVVFIDPNWITKYYPVFDKNHAETGENDIAILQMDISNINNINPAKIGSMSLNSNDSIIIQSYPSDIYGKLGVFTVLPRKSENNSIGSLLNFDGSAYGPYNLIETKPSSLGQSGASGGGIFNDQGQLIGIISNSIPSEILLKNKIRALTIDYIDERIRLNLGKSIFQYNQ